MFGWHVHEKAILLVLVPLRCVVHLLFISKHDLSSTASLLAAENNEYFRTFEIASVAGIFSLFPLLFTPAGMFYHGSIIIACSHLTETLIKIVYSVLWAVFVLRPIHRQVYQ